MEPLRLDDVFDDTDSFLTVDYTDEADKSTLWFCYNGSLQTSVAVDRADVRRLRDFLNEFLGDE